MEMLQRFQYIGIHMDEFTDALLLQLLHAGRSTGHDHDGFAAHQPGNSGTSSGYSSSLLQTTIMSASACRAASTPSLADEILNCQSLHILHRQKNWRKTVNVQVAWPDCHRSA